jgi:uncharacterized protein (TIGR02302 family)
MTDRPPPELRLRLRLRLARAALFWERVWPAAWPAVGIVGVFAVVALFDLLPALSADAHAAVLAAFALALLAAIGWGWRTAGLRAWPDAGAARRRIERSSWLPHRPLQALADRPSLPLDGGAAALWAAHQKRTRAAVRRLRIGWPAAGLARHDPWGVRSVLVILLLLGVIDARGDWRARFLHAVTPAFAAGAAAVPTTFDAWLTPPDYTGLPPQFLRAGDKGVLRVPKGSTLLAQVHGAGAVPRLAIDGKTTDFKPVDQENFRFSTVLNEGKSLRLTQGGSELGLWAIAVVPDHPPTISFARPPSGSARAALRLDYRAGDDYGVEGVKAVIRRPDGDPKQTITLDLPLPGLHLKDAKATSYHDLTPHPWAGLPVEIRLVATDALGQIGESAPVHMVLPERVFHNPVARAIVDQRKDLVKDASAAEPVAEILGDLNKRPVLYGDDPVVYLALRLAQNELRGKDSKASLPAVEQLMWQTALRIEDGRMSVAENDLRRLEQKLQDALAKNAPDAEIDRLMQQLQQALDRYMQAMAQELQRHPGERMQNPLDASRVLTPRDLQHMVDRARELARSGDREQARQLLSQLQNMLENLRAARPGEMSRGASQAQQTMKGLQQLMQRQQKLLDRSFRAQQQRRQDGGMRSDGQQPGDQSGEQQPGADQDGAGQPSAMGDAAGEQEDLRHSLGDMMRRLGEGQGDIPNPFGRAERSMKDAVGALRQGQPGEAIGPQTEALDQLQQGAREFARQLQQRMGPGRPDGSQLGTAERGDPNPTGRDPFGRPMSNGGLFDEGDVKIPDDNVLQKSREILDELRRRAGERSRPQLELDYIDRLLQRF